MGRKGLIMTAILAGLGASSFNAEELYYLKSANRSGNFGKRPTGCAASKRKARKLQNIRSRSKK